MRWGSQIKALKQGNYDQVIQAAKRKLESDPDDLMSHFEMAQAYESTGKEELALRHAKFCLSIKPDIFYVLTLAARCSAKLENYEDAYNYAQRALLDDKDPNLSRLAVLFLMLLSYIPGLKALRDTNERIVGSYAKETQWLRDYVAWYQRRKTSP